MELRVSCNFQYRISATTGLQSFAARDRSERTGSSFVVASTPSVPHRVNPAVNAISIVFIAQQVSSMPEVNRASAYYASALRTRIGALIRAIASVYPRGHRRVCSAYAFAYPSAEQISRIHAGIHDNDALFQRSHARAVEHASTCVSKLRAADFHGGMLRGRDETVFSSS